MPLVFSATDAGPDQGLLVVQDGQDAKDDGCTRLELDIHQALGHSFANVLKVHGGPLDKASDSDDGVKWGGGRGGLRRGLGLRGRVLGGRGVVDEREEVGGGCEHGGRGVGGLGLAGLDEPVAALGVSILHGRHSLLARKRKLVAACDGLDDNVLVLDTLLPELCECAVEECADDPVVPPGMHDGDPEARAVVCRGWRGETLDGGVEHCGVVYRKRNMGKR